MVDFQNQVSDEALCALVVAGDRSAEETLVRRYHRLVRICARPFFLTGGDSEDLLQEGMLGLLKAIREFDLQREASFHTYAEVCIRNQMLSAIKAASRDKHSPLNYYISLENPLFDGTGDFVSSSSDHQSQQNPEDVIIGREALQERKQALYRRLSVFESQVLAHYLNGLSYDEIAQETHWSTKSVDNAVQRIRRKLAQQLSFGDFSIS